MAQHTNRKLGAGIWSFSLPVITTCPGATSLCKTVCYARTGHLAFSQHRQRHRRNLRLSRSSAFEKVIRQRIHTLGIGCVRIHVAGDFYSPEYVARWQRIVRTCRHTTFFTYTRSWRIPTILSELRSLAEEPNMHLWFSCDSETGEPPEAKGVCRAWMALDNEDAPYFPVHLIFRNRPRTLQKRIAGVLVCPYDQGVPNKERMTCCRCRLCFDKTKDRVWSKPVVLLAQ